MNHKERMLANLPYKSWLDGLEEERLECKKRFTSTTTFRRKIKKKKTALMK